MLYTLRHLLSILLLPFTVTVIVPVWLLRRDSFTEITRLTSLRVLMFVAGAVLLVVGLTLLVSTVLQFARRGKGTLAPWDPPRKLVVNGVYRFVRNPMISGVLFILLAESLITGSQRVFTWFVIFLFVNFIYIPLLEEARLAERFGDSYRLYKENVPRWIPRLSPWTPTWKQDSSASKNNSVQD